MSMHYLNSRTYLSWTLPCFNNLILEISNLMISELGVSRGVYMQLTVAFGEWIQYRAWHFQKSFVSFDHYKWSGAA